MTSTQTNQSAHDRRSSSDTSTSSRPSPTQIERNLPSGSPGASRPLQPSSRTNSISESTQDTANPVSVFPPLPPELLSTLHYIKTTLTTNFAETPPHTIQRLSELILRPRTHYKQVGSYLRALDRVVSVSSGAELFPLPTVDLLEGSSIDGVTLLNGTAGALGSDESLGGALLTPIPWLRNDHHGEVRIESTETVDGPNGVGSIETVSVSIRGISSTTTSMPVMTTATTSTTTTISIPHAPGQTMRDAGAVTQGELLRQEQQAGVVPVAHIHVGRQTRSATARGLAEEGSTGGAVSASTATEDEMPHVRGPNEVGVEDMGPQAAKSGTKGGFDVEAALGRSLSHRGSEKPKRDGHATGSTNVSEIVHDATSCLAAETTADATASGLIKSGDSTEMLDADDTPEPSKSSDAT